MQTKSCQVMIKPTGSVCNLDCKYCFYLEKEMLYPDRKANYRMSDDMLELFIKQHIAAQDVNDVIFAWQGGGTYADGVGILSASAGIAAALFWR